MKNEDYYNEFLDKFLAGEITKGEADELKSAAEQNPELQSELATHIEARANIRIAGEAELKKKLSTAYDELPAEPVAKNRTINPLFRWAVVAASIVGLAFAVFYLSPKSEPAFQLADLINETPSLTIRGNQSNELFMETWKIGESAYQQKKYKESINAFGQLQNDSAEANAHAGKIAIYKGLGHLQLKAYNEAINQFKSVPNTNPLVNDAKWYIALTHLDKGDKEKSKTLLQAIATDKNHFKHSQANDLLNNQDLWND